jgi:hypothetical protein
MSHKAMFMSVKGTSSVDSPEAPLIPCEKRNGRKWPAILAWQTSWMHTAESSRQCRVGSAALAQWEVRHEMLGQILLVRRK